MKRITFNLSASFVSYRWNSDFFWILPDSPSGISILYYPETKLLNTYELEKERSIALADKVKQSDPDKLAKQKLYIPTSVMELVWMTQNLLTIISLCFGPSSHSARMPWITLFLQKYYSALTKLSKHIGSHAAILTIENP
jgi:hypothetical protein